MTTAPPEKDTWYHGKRLPPIGLIYVAAALEKSGNGVCFELPASGSAGIAFVGEAGKIGGAEWKKERYLTVTLENTSKYMLRLTVGFFCGGSPAYAGNNRDLRDECRRGGRLCYYFRITVERVDALGDTRAL